MTEEEKIQQNLAWNHLVLSSNQRLSVTQFYFAIATALAGSLFVLVQKEQPSNIIGIPGWLLTVLTLIFWQWYKRSTSFVKNAEKTLRHKRLAIFLFYFCDNWNTGNNDKYFMLLERNHFLDNSICRIGYFGVVFLCFRQTDIFVA